MEKEDVDGLGRSLLEEMERLDPSYPDEITWEGLDERERDFYRYCALAVIREARARELIK